MANERNAECGPVLVGWDGSERGRDALALAGLLARAQGLVVRVALAYVGAGFAPRQYEDLLEEGAQKRLAEAPLELLGEVESTCVAAPGKSPAHGLQREAERSGAQMIVIGSTHRGALGRVAPGSVAGDLLHGAPCAVAVAPAGYANGQPGPFRVIAVAYDETPGSRAAVERATELALKEQAALKVISVAAPLGAAFGVGGASGVGFYMAQAHEEAREQRREAIEELVASLPGEVRADARLRSGDAADEILAECEAGVDLLLMGSRGYGALGRALLGSVSSKLMHSAPCPVMVLPRIQAGREENIVGVGSAAASS